MQGAGLHKSACGLALWRWFTQAGRVYVEGRLNGADGVWHTAGSTADTLCVTLVLCCWCCTQGNGDSSALLLRLARLSSPGTSVAGVQCAAGPCPSKVCMVTPSRHHGHAHYRRVARLVAACPHILCGACWVVNPAASTAWVVAAVASHAAQPPMCACEAMIRPQAVKRRRVVQSVPTPQALWRLWLLSGWRAPGCLLVLYLTLPCRPYPATC
jgi:hypothetical protein